MFYQDFRDSFKTIINSQFFLFSMICASTAVVSMPIKAHIEEVEVVASRVNQIGLSISASTGVIEGDEIKIRALQRTGSLLELVPGMVVTQHSGTGKANQYFLRGFNLDHGTDFATFIDGMPANMRSHGHGQGYTDLNFIIPETINSIAYKKGPYYAAVGDFSGAGSAHITTASVFDKSGADSGSAAITAGGDDYYRAVIQTDFLAAEGQWFVAAELNCNQGPWTDISEGLKKNNLLVKYQRPLFEGQFQVSLMAYNNRWNSADQIPQRAVINNIGEGLIDSLGSIDTSLGGHSDRYSLSAQWKNSHWQASVYAINYDLNLWSNFTYFLDNASTGDQFEQLDSRSIFGGYVRNEQHHTLLNVPLTLRLGATVRYDDIDEVGLFSTQNRSRLGAIRHDKVQESSIGLFWDNSLVLTDKLKAVASVRYDYFHFDVDGLLNANVNGVDLSKNSGKAKDDKYSFKGGLVYSVNPNWELYTSLGQGFHSNDARGTVITVDPADGAPVDTVEPLVGSLGYEVGVRGFFIDQLNVSLALWRLTLDSELLFVGDAGNTEASRASEREGIELTAYYRLDDTWTLDLEYAYADANFSEAALEGDNIPGAINDVVQAGVSFDNKQGKFGSLRFRYFGERPLEESGSIRSDSSTVMNLRAGYQLNQWLFKSDVINLLDSDDHDIDYYYASRLASEVATTSGTEDIHFHRLEPRTLRFTAEYVF